MFTKNILALTAIAGLAEQAVAFNSHRHLHRAADGNVKRDYVTHWVTVYETDYVTAGQDSKAQATEYVAPAAAPTTPAAAAPPAPSSQAPPPPPPPAPTTLATSAKPAAPAAPSSVVVNVQNPVKQPSPVTSSAPAATPQPSGGKGGSGISGKRGLAYNDATLANLFGGSCKSCSWGYNWGSNPAGLDKKLTYIPMLWGDIPVHTNNWDSDAEKAIANGAPAMFSFNEPDHNTQANMSPEAAAAAHIKYMNKYAGRVKIGAPSVTNGGGDSMGVGWLKQFMAACGGKCQVDFCNVHWYSQSQYKDTLFEHLDAAHKACDGKPIWLTEFAPTDGDAGSFLKEVIPKLEATEYLEAYSYFMVSPSSLMSGVSGLSSFGQVYAQLA
ncbi:glycoside hydrolase [Purpureocillium lavendulum]|uniref:Glycoside hydrolase n=1 Tax=Purpureocillium lavendulum TaxID=1247861 RepID=A0AB34FZB7_9HYPO|nr:glycoside hydrolase [Purpureocillium lavendulum]